MGFLISPGVQVREYEVAPNTLTTSSSPVGFAGKFEWGPAEEITSINTKTSLKQVFGAPSEDNAIDWFTCANFLDYSSNLITVRCINEENSYNATVGCYNALKSIESDLGVTVTPEELIAYYDAKDDIERIQKDKVTYSKGLSTETGGTYEGKGFEINDEGKTEVEESVIADYTTAKEAFDAAKAAHETAKTNAQGITDETIAGLQSDLQTAEARKTEIENDDTLTQDEKDTAIEALDIDGKTAALQEAQGKITALQTAAEALANAAIDSKLEGYYNFFVGLNNKNKKFEKFNTEVLGRIKSSSCLIKNTGDWTNKYASGTAEGQERLGEFAAKYPSDLGNNIGVYMVDGNGYGRVYDVQPNVDAYIYLDEDQGAEITFDPSPYGDEFTASGCIVLKDEPAYTKVIDGVKYYRIAGVDLDNGGKYNAGMYISPPKAKFPKPLSAKNANGVPVAKVELWKYASTFMAAPGTSNYAKQRGGLNDEMHIVVVDETGALTGTKGSVIESFANVSKASDAKYDDGNTSYYVNVLRDKSSWVTWLNHPSSGTNWGNKARNTVFDNLSGSDVEQGGYVGRFAGGYSGTKYVDVYDKYRGWDLFADPERTNVSVIMSGNASSAEQKYLVDLCESRKDCVVVLSPLYSDVIGETDTSKITNNVLRTRNNLGDSTYAFFDCNWKYMYDMYNDVYRWVPCNADVAGIMARTDDDYAAWWSPAGLNRGKLTNVVKLAWNPSGDERDVMYEAAINAICTFLAEGTVLFGDKTMISRISPLANINARRCLIILEKTIAKAAKNLLFEFNDMSSRIRFIQMVEPFLETVRSGRGITDYMLICDDTNNTPEIVDQNAFVGDIYIKPTKTINFIQLNFYAVAASVEFNEIVGNV